MKDILELLFALVFCTLILCPLLFWLLQSNIGKKIGEWYCIYIDIIIEFLNKLVDIKKEK